MVYAMAVGHGAEITDEPDPSSSIGFGGDPMCCIHPPLLGAQVSVGHSVVDSLHGMGMIERLEAILSNVGDFTVSQPGAVVNANLGTL
jgi:hypothetical protein